MSDQSSERMTISVPEAARRIGISPASAYVAAAKGEIPTIKVGGRILVLRNQLDRMLNGEGR